MIALKKNCRLTFLASLLALNFGGAYAQDNLGSPPSAQAGSPQTSATAQNTQNAQATAPQAAPTGSLQAVEGSASGSGRPRDNASSSGASGNQTTQQGTKNKNAPYAAVVYMMMPVEVATGDAPVQRGCWVNLYDAEKYTGESLTLAGPTTIDDMSGPFGINWDDRVKSLQTGPQAMLTVFDDEDLEERVAQFKPGQQVPDVSARMGFFDEFGSIKLDCQRS